MASSVSRGQAAGLARVRGHPRRGAGDHKRAPGRQAPGELSPPGYFRAFAPIAGDQVHQGDGHAEVADSDALCPRGRVGLADRLARAWIKQPGLATVVEPTVAGHDGFHSLVALDHLVYLNLAGRAQEPITLRRRVRQIGERWQLGALFSTERWPVINAAQEVETR